AKAPEAAPPATSAPPGKKSASAPAARGSAPAAAAPAESAAAEPPAGHRADVGGKPPEIAAKAPASARVPDLNQQRPAEPSGRARTGRTIGRPQAVVRMAKPPLKKAPLKEEKKAAEPAAQKPVMKLTAEMQEKFKGPGAKAEEILRKAAPAEALPAVPVDLEDEDVDGKGKRPGVVSGRDKRHQQRNERAKQRKDRQQDEVLKGGRLLL